MITKHDIQEALLPHQLWKFMGEDLFKTMPIEYKEHIGRKAVENACYIDQLETINASRHQRGVRPLTKTEFYSGEEFDEK